MTNINKIVDSTFSTIMNNSNMIDNRIIKTILKYVVECVLISSEYLKLAMGIEIAKLAYLIIGFGLVYWAKSRLFITIFEKKDHVKHIHEQYLYYTWKLYNFAHFISLGLLSASVFYHVSEYNIRTILAPYLKDIINLDSHINDVIKLLNLGALVPSSDVLELIKSLCCLVDKNLANLNRLIVRYLILDRSLIFIKFAILFTYIIYHCASVVMEEWKTIKNDFYNPYLTLTQKTIVSMSYSMTQRLMALVRSTLLGYLFSLGLYTNLFQILFSQGRFVKEASGRLAYFPIMFNTYAKDKNMYYKIVTSILTITFAIFSLRCFYLFHYDRDIIGFLRTLILVSIIPQMVTGAHNYFLKRPYWNDIAPSIQNINVSLALLFNIILIKFNFVAVTPEWTRTVNIALLIMDITFNFIRIIGAEVILNPEDRITSNLSLFRINELKEVREKLSQVCSSAFYKSLNKLNAVQLNNVINEALFEYSLISESTAALALLAQGTVFSIYSLILGIVETPRTLISSYIIKVQTMSTNEATAHRNNIMSLDQLDILHIVYQWISVILTYLVFLFSFFAYKLNWLSTVQLFYIISISVFLFIQITLESKTWVGSVVSQPVEENHMLAFFAFFTALSYKIKFVIFQLGKFAQYIGKLIYKQGIPILNTSRYDIIKVHIHSTLGFQLPVNFTDLIFHATNAFSAVSNATKELFPSVLKEQILKFPVPCIIKDFTFVLIRKEWIPVDLLHIEIISIIFGVISLAVFMHIAIYGKAHLKYNLGIYVDAIAIVGIITTQDILNLSFALNFLDMIEFILYFRLAHCFLSISALYTTYRSIEQKMYNVLNDSHCPSGLDDEEGKDTDKDVEYV